MKTFLGIISIFTLTSIQASRAEDIALLCKDSLFGNSEIFFLDIYKNRVEARVESEFNPINAHAFLSYGGGNIVVMDSKINWSVSGVTIANPSLGIDLRLENMSLDRYTGVLRGNKSN